MSEVEYEGLLDVVRTAVEPAPEKNRAPKAANENHLAWPVIAFPEGWYGVG